MVWFVKKMSEQSFTPPLPAESENRRSSAERDNVRLSLEEQVKLLFSEMKTLKEAQI